MTDSSVAFLMKIEDRDPSSLGQFEKVFSTMGYSTLFMSDYYGLRDTSPEKRADFLRRTFANCEKFEKESGITPRLIVDILGFDLGTHEANRALVRGNKYVAGYHIIDEPDSHPTGKVEEFRATPEEVNAMFGVLGAYDKPIMITFENQASHPAARKWAYRNNTDELYLKYMEVVNKWHMGRNWFGYDYYLFNRATKPITTQLRTAQDMRYYNGLVARAGMDDWAFGWCEPTFQDLNYMRRYAPHPRGPSPTELWAQGWIYWAGGQRGIRGDFGYTKVPRNPEGLLEPQYAEHLKVVQQLNKDAAQLHDFLQLPPVWLFSTDKRIVFSARWNPATGKALLMAVNASGQKVSPVVLVGHPVLHHLGEFAGYHDERFKARFSEQGWLTLEMEPYQVLVFQN